MRPLRADRRLFPLIHFPPLPTEHLPVNATTLPDRRKIQNTERRTRFHKPHKTADLMFVELFPFAQLPFERFCRHAEPARHIRLRIAAPIDPFQQTALFQGISVVFRICHKQPLFIRVRRSSSSRFLNSHFLRKRISSFSLAFRIKSSSEQSSS